MRLKTTDFSSDKSNLCVKKINVAVFSDIFRSIYRKMLLSTNLLPRQRKAPLNLFTVSFYF